MNPYLSHTLMMLEDAGMRVPYPVFRKVTFDSDGVANMKVAIFASNGRRVSIEGNIKLKLLMVFTLLDFYIDEKHPLLCGRSYAQKYRKLPKKNESEVILKEIFRIWKMIRNALIHESSSLTLKNGQLAVNYEYKANKNLPSINYQLKISNASLDSLFTTTLMYVKNQFGNDKYSKGIASYLYSNILAGIGVFTDEFGNKLADVSSVLKLAPYMREIYFNHIYHNSAGYYTFEKPAHTPNYPIDFYIEINKKKYIVPSEALDEIFSISQSEIISTWEVTGKLPLISL